MTPEPASCASCGFSGHGARCWPGATSRRTTRPRRPTPRGNSRRPWPAESGAGEGWKLAAPKDTELRGNWWEMYQDQQLNDLEERVVVSNQTIAAAEANYRSSHALADEARAALFPSVSAVPSVTRSRSSAGASSGGKPADPGGGAATARRRPRRAAGRRDGAAHLFHAAG